MSKEIARTQIEKATILSAELYELDSEDSVCITSMRIITTDGNVIELIFSGSDQIGVDDTFLDLEVIYKNTKQKGK